LTAPLTYSFPSSNGIDTCQGFIWPVENAKAVIHFAHGMSEHINRHQLLAEFLNRHGYIFCGHDHIGHGHTAPDQDHQGHMGEKDGWMYAVQDQVTGIKLMQERFPGLPMFAAGFSLGAMMLRIALAECCSENIKLQGVFLGGVGGEEEQQIYAMIDMINEQIAEHGPDYRSDIMRNFTRQKIRNNEEQKAAKTKPKIGPGDPGYDPYFGITPTLATYIDAMQLMCHSCHPQAYNDINHSLPILIMSGGKDPLGHFGELAPQFCDTYKGCGCNDVEVIVYPEYPHEVFRPLPGETEPKAFSDILNWLEKHM